MRPYVGFRSPPPEGGTTNGGSVQMPPRMKGHEFAACACEIFRDKFRD